MSASGAYRKSTAGVAAGSELVSIVAQSTGVVDGVANANFGQLSGQDGVYSGIAVQPVLFNGATWDRPRTPAVFKFALASALGATAVWTPAAGKKFRLMAYKMMLSQNASLAAGAQWTPAFLDAAAATGLSDTFFVPTAAGTTLGVVSSGWTVLGNGYLSSAANNVLNINLPVALASSSLVVQVIGTEE